MATLKNNELVFGWGGQLLLILNQAKLLLLLQNHLELT